MAFLRYCLVMLLCLIYQATSVPKAEDQDCVVVLNSFANVSAAFTYCAIRNARPVTMCQKCIGSYLEVKLVYDDINRIETQEGSVCASELVNLDRLEVFSSGYKYISDLWQKARCNTCFVPDAKGGPSTELTEPVKELLNASSILKDCIKTHINDTTGDTKRVCEECIGVYSSMNNFFEEIKSSAGEEPCMDVVDLVNNTRYEWSDYLKCCNDRRKPQLLLTLSISGLITCTVLFYLVAYIVTPKGEQPVLREKRWREISSIASMRKSSDRRRSSANAGQM